MKKDLAARKMALELEILDIATSLRHVAHQLTDRAENAANDQERELLDALGCTVMVLHRATGNVANGLVGVVKL